MKNSVSGSGNSTSTSDANIKQQCGLTRLYFALVMFSIIYAGGIIFFAYRKNWLILLLWLVGIPIARWASVRLSGFTTKLRGYGPVIDRLPSGVSKAPIEVAFYSHNGCPYCPIVKQRLEALQKEMGFTLTKTDLSFKPQVATSKGIRSVPVVEAGSERLVGNATTEQMAQLIASAQART